MARAAIAAPFSALRGTIFWPARSQAQTRPSSSPAQTHWPPGMPSTRTTMALSSKPTSAACLPIGPVAPAKGQATRPFAPEVISSCPLATKDMLLTFTG